MSVKECLISTPLTVLSDGHIAVCPIILLNQALYSNEAVSRELYSLLKDPNVTRGEQIIP